MKHKAQSTLKPCAASRSNGLVDEKPACHIIILIVDDHVKLVRRVALTVRIRHRGVQLRLSVSLPPLFFVHATPDPLPNAQAHQELPPHPERNKSFPFIFKLLLYIPKAVDDIPDRFVKLGGHNDAMQHRTIRISGDGTPYRSYLYASDLVIWLWTILFRGQSCRPYNVGSAADISIAELARTVRDIVSPQTTVEVTGQPVPGKPAERYVPSVERCEVELGLRVRVPLDEAILRTCSWYQQQTNR